MSLQDLLYPLTLLRDTDDIISTSDITSTLSVTFQSNVPCHVKVKIAGVGVFGQCLVVGADENDQALSELYDFSRNGTLVGKQIFKTVIGATTSGFDVGTVEAKGKLRSGESTVSRQTIRTIYGRIYRPKPRDMVSVPGSEKEEVFKFMCNKGDSDLLKGDIIFDNVSYYQFSVPLQPIWGMNVIHHYESFVKRIES